MRLITLRVSRCVSAFAGLALLASTAAASPLSAAVGQPSVRAQTSLELQRKFAILKEGRLLSDRAAAMESVQIALSRVADGSTYIWHRPSGLYSGSVKPTKSFRTPNGELCRHIVVEMSSEEDFRVVEGIACRGANKVWRLDG